MAADVTIRTSLLEHRLLAGRARAVSRSSAAASPSAWTSARSTTPRRSSSSSGISSTRTRSTTSSPTSRKARAACATCPTVLWIARAAGFGSTWRELARNGLMTIGEARAVAAAGALHRRAARAPALPARPARGPAGVRRAERARPQLGLVRHAGQARERAADAALLPRGEAGAPGQHDPAAEPARALYPGGHRSRCRSTPSSSRSTSCSTCATRRCSCERPAAMLDAFLTLQRHRELKGMTARTLRALWRDRTLIDGAFRRDPANRARFIAMFRAERGLLHELRRMNLYGILGQYLPVFGRIVGPDAARPLPRVHGRRAHPDGDPQPAPVHRGAARARVSAVLAAHRRFRAARGALPRRACSTTSPRAAAATIRRSARATRAASAASTACRTRTRELVAWLVADHLVDVVDRAEAGPVRSRRHRGLRAQGRHRAAADRAVSADRRRHSRHQPARSGTTGRASCSKTCTTRRARVLAGAAPTRTVMDSLEARQTEAQRLLRLYAVPDGAEASLWRHLDTPYFQRHTAEEIAWHARHLYWRVERTAPVVKARLSRDGAGLQVLVYLPDQKELFARLCGFFGRAGLSILEAKIHTTRAGYALDTFAVHDPAQRGGVVSRDAVRWSSSSSTRVLTEQRAAGAARRRPHPAAAEALPADARGADLPRRQGHALHPRSRRRRPPGPARAHRLHAGARPTSTSAARRSTRWASARRTCS